MSYLTPLQRNKLLERADNQQRSLLEALFSKAVDPDKEVVYARYLKGIQEGNGKIEHGVYIGEYVPAVSEQSVPPISEQSVPLFLG